MEVLDTILMRYRNKKPAFLIGNGPNLFSGIMPSWKDLLNSAADEPINFSYEGLTNTELYDLVELNSKDYSKIKQRIVDKLIILPNHNLSTHRRLLDFTKIHDIPVLTTNFDEAFEKSIGAKLFHIDSKDFTRFYPWKTYYGLKQLQLPNEGFGIWKIHGDVRYKDSLRLGLTDYMGSVERARGLIHKGDDRLFKGKNVSYWKGHQTWLHIWFNQPIIIFGFNYGPDEVFLRWLLIERKRYFNMVTGGNMDVTYISRGKPEAKIKNFMENLGVEIVTIDSHNEIYVFGLF